MAKESSMQPGSNLPPAFIEKWLDNQSKEIENRHRELELRKQTDNNNFEYAKLALDTKADDTRDEREHDSQQHKRILRFAGTMAVVLIGFLIYCLETGKDTFAIEILKAAIFIASGGFGGYALGARQSQDKKTTKK